MPGKISRRQIAAIEGPQPRNRDPNREPMRLGTPRLGTHEADPILAEQLGGSPKRGESHLGTLG